MELNNHQASQTSTVDICNECKISRTDTRTVSSRLQLAHMGDIPV